MKKVAKIIFLCALAAGGFWLWTILFPSPAKIITRRLSKLAQAVTVHPGEGYLPRMLAAQTVGGFFTTNVEVALDLPGHHQNLTVGRDEIVQSVMAGNLSGGLTVRISDLVVSVANDQETAQVEATVQGRVPGDSDVIVQQMKFSLRKINGEWLITRLQTIRTFSSNILPAGISII